MTALRDLAEDYVMGRLDPEPRAQVEARIAAPQGDDDRALALAVRDLAADWHAVDLTAAPEPMSAGAWESLQAALAAGAAEGSAETTPEATPETSAETSAAPRPASAPPLRAGARTAARPTRGERSVRGWQRAAGGALAACVALAAALFFQVFAPQPAVMAILLDDDGGSVALIEAFVDDSLRVTPLEDFSPEGAQVLQIWTKPDPDGPPVSLGVLGRAMRAHVEGPDLPRPSTGQLYEITVEPPGGSPTGLPTGRIVGKGLAQRPL
ncbi:anti-sigma factor [uncultured Albimonas sp.]|uniref:anti-sigma factor n=1 Tax=uncultured Albimonas sp. TaxID=1331701 RepID=UPI0030ED2D0E